MNRRFVSLAVNLQINLIFCSAFLKGLQILECTASNQHVLLHQTHHS